MRASLLFSPAVPGGLWWVPRHPGCPRAYPSASARLTVCYCYRPAWLGAAVCRRALDLRANVRWGIALKSQARPTFGSFSSRRGGLWTTLPVDAAGLSHNYSGIRYIFFVSTLGVANGLG